MISFKDIEFEYQSSEQPFLALKKLSFEIARGSFLAIIGTSGSGKTTLMNLLGLLALPTQGEMLWNGRRTNALSESELATLRNKNIGYVFQSFFLLPRLTVLENILLPSKYIHSETESQVPCEAQVYETQAYKLLSRFGIEEHAHKLPSKLSGGQKQRVAICRALLLDPDMILADEPTGALDSENTSRVLDILEELNQEGKTVVIITHDQNVAQRARRIMRLMDGRVESDSVLQKEAEFSDFESASHLVNKITRPPSGSPLSKALKNTLNRVRKTTTDLRSHIAHALFDMKANPVRSLFTLIGLAIGVSSVIIMITLTAEARNIFQKFFDTAGGKRGYVTFDGRTADKLGTPRWQGLQIESEVPQVTSFFEKYGSINAEIEANRCNFQSRYKTAVGDIKGVSTVAHFNENNLQISQGRFLTPHELEKSSDLKSVLLGSKASQNLFPKTSNESTTGSATGSAQNWNYPIGEWVTLSGCNLSLVLRVAGVLAEQDTFFDDSLNNAVWVPTQLLLKGGLPDKSRRFVTVPRDGVSPTWLAESLKNYLTMRTNNRFPFRLFVAEEHVAKVNMMLSLLAGLTVIIGGVCTLIGGIGVMNIMLVNIAERVKEIGIRKALGAKDFQIRNQFLFESCFLCLLGGIVGILAGAIVCNLAILVVAQIVPQFVQETFVWNGVATTIALVSSLLAGIIFGLLPARRAAALSVVESLQRE